jgi:hypothetical protein
MLSLITDWDIDDFAKVVWVALHDRAYLYGISKFTHCFTYLKEVEC